MKLPMAYFTTLLGLAAISSIPATSAVILRGSLAADMQPETVAKTLKNVQDNWKAWAASFIRCNSTGADPECENAPHAFGKSCAVVVGAVVQGSSGDRAVAKEYMADICSQSLLTEWYQQQCLGLKTVLESTMTADSYENRNNFASAKLCNKFWIQFLDEEQKRFAQEEAERQEAEKKAQEEAAKKAKEEAEKAEEDRKAREEAEKKAKEEEEQKAREAQIEEAKRAKAEAEAKAGEAAEHLAKKKAEAEELARKAQEKMREAEQAEQAHKQALENWTAHAGVTDALPNASLEVAPVNGSTAPADSSAVPVNTTEVSMNGSNSEAEGTAANSTNTQN